METNKKRPGAATEMTVYDQGLASEVSLLEAREKPSVKDSCDVNSRCYFPVGPTGVCSKNNHQNVGNYRENSKNQWFFHSFCNLPYNSLGFGDCFYYRQSVTKTITQTQETIGKLVVVFDFSVVFAIFLIIPYVSVIVFTTNTGINRPDFKITTIWRVID